MNAGVQCHIFEHFSLVLVARQFPGTPDGMMITKEAVEYLVDDGLSNVHMENKC